ncbi:MAG TPA: hypothetical protein PK156_14870, partial [Polyangium sp.]|nr:hypothetical protein [Polyangium sp.]
ALPPGSDKSSPTRRMYGAALLLISDVAGPLLRAEQRAISALSDVGSGADAAIAGECFDRVGRPQVPAGTKLFEL